MNDEQHDPQVGDRVRLAYWDADWHFDVERIEGTEMYGTGTPSYIGGQWSTPDDSWRYIGPTPTADDEVSA